MIFLAEEGATAAAETGVPTFTYGIIAFVVFIALAVITYSYRDVANRSVSKGSDNQGHH